MKITIKTIAEKAQVSLSTVSRVINNPESVDKEKVEIVNYWIKKLEYQPNIGAQTLKSNKTQLIGVSIPNFENPYFVKIIEILEEITTEHKYNIILQMTKYNKLKEKENIDNFLRRNVDGIILIVLDKKNIEFLKRKNIPHLALTNEVNETNSVSICHKTGGRLVGEHLLQLDKKSISFIGKENDLKFIGFKSKLYDEGVENRNKNNIFIENSSATNYEIRSIIKENFNKNGVTNDAFFAGNDLIAFELMKELQERGIEIPKDVSIVGFDNTFLAKIFKITSVNQPIEEITKLGFKILLEQIKKNRYEKIGNFTVKPNLVIRESSLKF